MDTRSPHLPMLGVVLVVVAFALAGAVGTASAQECDLDSTNRQKLVDTYNQNVDEVPGVLRGQLANERIDLRLDTSDGVTQYVVVTREGGQIDSFERGTAENPTIRVETSESTLCGIATADDPTAAASEAYDDGDISIKGVGTVNSVKIEAAKAGIGIVRTLSGLF